jgi:hypothetical protein
MNKKVLLIYKSENECAQVLGEYLKSLGYDFNMHISMEDVSEEEFKESLCVIGHPASRDAGKLRELIIKYPIGVVIDVGEFCLPGEENHSFVEMQRESKGVVYFYKPYSVKKIKNAINLAIEEAKRRSLETEVEK